MGAPVIPTADRLQYPTYLPLRTMFAALVIAHGGRVSFSKLRKLAHQIGVKGSIRKADGSSNGSRVGRAADRRVRELVDAGLVVRDGDDYVAVDLVDLADWLADQVEAEVAETRRRRSAATGEQP